MFSKHFCTKCFSPSLVGVVLAHKGVGHLAEGLLILHNLMGDAGENVKQKQKKSKQKGVEKTDCQKIVKNTDMQLLIIFPISPCISDKRFLSFFRKVISAELIPNIGRGVELKWQSLGFEMTLILLDFQIYILLKANL